jgi:hypothetical protein
MSRLLCASFVALELPKHDRAPLVHLEHRRTASHVEAEARGVGFVNHSGSLVARPGRVPRTLPCDLDGSVDADGQF